MTDLPKTFDPAAIESRWYAHWENTGAFRPHRPDAEPFTIVIPPPNVTGSLHIGHALDLTLQDILTRHARLRGKDALWVVGTDHAGIATQMVVERQLAERQQKRTDFSREEFVAKVWEWKEESGGAITTQMRRLGASCDWANERFTMDEGFSRAVRRVFVDLYDRKLLYRDKRLVNWDPGLKTAISDLEVETREVQGKFWHLSYPLADGSGAISVATTRPETMLADMAVAVNAKDARYTHLVGKQVRLPITGRLVPIVTDEHANPELGSGAVKITPGHDFNDFEVGKRAGFKAADMLNMFDGDAKVVQTADGLIPDEFVGLDRFDARARVVEMIEAERLLEKVEDRVVQTPYGDRSGVVIEPWLTDQWYVDAATLAGPAIAAVRDGDIRVVPETWKKTWFNWLENIQPWCVSRQLWWGHRIPAWYGPKIPLGGGDPVYGMDVQPTAAGDPAISFYGDEVFVAATEAEAVAIAQAHYGETNVVRVTAGPSIVHPAGEVNIYRDSDVLDTWFSSALWPFATLGWPEDEAEKSFVPSENEGRSEPRASTKFIQSNAAGGVEGLGTNGSGLKQRPNLLRRHYPNDVLVSGFDIIFFWDARMAMQGFEFMKERPWKTLYLHGLVRDAKGAKMSKSKGNTVDPIGLIDRYGADALRFTLAAMESQGRDIKLDEKRIEGYRNFATKLWNAARFCQGNGIGASQTLEPPAAALPVNRWIIGETVRTVQALDLALADLRFDESVRLIYQLTWDRYCDWYLELIKAELAPDAAGEGAAETRQVAGWVLDQILVMLHPFMPFITEELWHAMPVLSEVEGPVLSFAEGGPRGGDLIHAKWPIADARALDPEAGPEIDWLIRLVGGIRTARTELGVTPGVRLALHVVGADASTMKRLERNGAALRRMARIETIAHAPAPVGGAAQIVIDEATFVLPLEGVIDIAAERARLGKAMAQAEKERDTLAERLDSPGFVEKAKPDAIDKARADHAERSAEAERIGVALSRLS